MISAQAMSTMQSVIEKMLTERGGRGIILFPYGQGGMDVKRVLNECYGVMEDVVVSDRFAAFNPAFKTYDELKSMDLRQYVVLYTISSAKKYLRYYNEICRLFPREDVYCAYESPAVREDLSDLLEWIEPLRLSPVMRFDASPLIVEGIMKLKRKRPHLLEEFKRYLEANGTAEQKLILLQLFYAVGVFDGELMSRYLQLIDALEDPEWKYRFFRLSSYMVFFRRECLYDDFYLDRRRLMKSLAKEMCLSLPLEKETERRSGAKRIALLALTLSDGNAGVELIAAQYANSLAASGYSVAVFSDEKDTGLNYMTCQDGDAALIPVFYSVRAREANEKRSRNYRDDVLLEYTESMSRGTSLQMLLKGIAAFAPDCILDMSDEFSVASAVLYGRYPILYIPMRGYTSSCFFDRFGARNKEVCIQLNQRFRTVSKGQMLDLMPWESVLPQRAYSREDYGLSNSDFILTTVGDRLPTEVTEDMSVAVCGLLERNPDMKWILVGEKIPDFFPKKYGHLIDNGQLILWGYENNLMAFYGMCDVFVNPDRIGGGGSLGMAVHAGLPIAATNRVFNDAWKLYDDVAVDGGYPELAKYIMRLKNDKQLCRQISKRHREVAEQARTENENKLVSEIRKLILEWEPHGGAGGDILG